MPNNIRHIEIKPGVFRTFKVYDNYGTRAWKTYLEATRSVKENKDRWNHPTNVRGEKYQYQIRVVETTIIVNDDVYINPVPPWLI